MTVTDNENQLSLRLRTSQHRHRNIAKPKIEEKSIQKYRAGGYGLRYIDLMEDFNLTKKQCSANFKASTS